MSEGTANRVSEYEPPAGSVVQSIRPQASLLLVLWQRRWSVFLMVLLAMAGAVAYVLKATPIFTSTSRLYVQQVGPKILAEAQGALAKSDNYLYTQAELLKSTPIIASAIESAGADRMRTFEAVDNLLEYIKDNLAVTVGKKDEIISIAFDSPYPQEAAQLVNCLVEAYVSFQARQKRSTAAEVLKILQKEKEKRDAEYAEAFKAVVEFRKANGAIWSEDASRNNIAMQRLARLSEALTEAQLQTAEAGATYAEFKAMLDNPTRLRQTARAQAYNRSTYWFVPRDKEDEDLQAQLTGLELQLALAQQRQLGPDHATVQSIEVAIQQVKRTMQEKDRAFAEAYVAALARGVQTAREREAVAQKFFDQQQTIVSGLNAQAAEYARLDANLKRAEKLSDVLNDRIKELSVTEDAGALNVTVLEVARVEDKPTKPAKARVLAIALVLGLMLGSGLALLRDWMDQRLRSAEEITAALDLPILGVVPHIRHQRNPSRRGQTVRLAPLSDTAEAYHTIRTAIAFGVPAGKCRTLLLTSPSPGDGKTTSASNLAIAMALAGQRVLVLDADFRRPMQHRIFLVKDEVGLSSVLAGQATLEAAIQRTAVERLDVLPCGPIPANPYGILDSPAFAQLLRELAGRYDHVVVDSPPVMPVADARILAAMCDLTVLVLRAEKSTRTLSELARDGLLSVGSRVLGVLVNDAPRRRGRYGYYSGYGYYRYGYYRHSESSAGANGNGKGAAASATEDPAQRG